MLALCGVCVFTAVASHHRKPAHQSIHFCQCMRWQVCPLHWVYNNQLHRHTHTWDFARSKHLTKHIEKREKGLTCDSIISRLSLAVNRFVRFLLVLNAKCYTDMFWEVFHFCGINISTNFKKKKIQITLNSYSDTYSYMLEWTNLICLPVTS